MTVLRKIISAVENTIMILIILLFIGMMALKLNNFQFLTVLSGSMEPELPVGSVVCIQPIDYDSVKIGDDITFHASENSEYIVTHKVIEKNEQARTITTKGVANDAADGAIPEESIIGIVRFDIPVIGQFLNFIHTLQGKICVGIVVVAWIIVSFFVKKLGGGDEKETA